MKVLVPTDGSERSTKAVEMALKMAEKEGAEVTLLSVAHYATGDFEALPADLQIRFELVAKNALDKAKAMFDQKGIKVSTRLEYGLTPGNNIIQLAEGGGFDQVILGSTGSTGLSRLFMGSTASKVAQHAPCTVTIVK
jgi:nucleotide-binding universal stress UspA family protein